MQLESGHEGRGDDRLAQRRRGDRHLVRRVEERRPDRERQHVRAARSHEDTRFVEAVRAEGPVRGAGVNLERVFAGREPLDLQKEPAGPVAVRLVSLHLERHIWQRPAIEPQHAA